MSSKPQPSIHVATFSPSRARRTGLFYTGSLVALALAIGGLGAPAALAQGAKTTVPAVQNTMQTPDLAGAYYHYMLAHEYEQMAATYGRSDYATRAVEEYKMALDDDPTSRFLNDGLAELYYRTGHIKDAIESAQAILAKDPNNLQAHKLLGDIYLRSLSQDDQPGPEADMLKLATGEYEKIVQLEPKNVDNHLMLGQLYAFAKHPKKAEAQFAEAQKIDPGSEATALNLARLYSSEGNNALAIKSLASLPPEAQTAKTEFVLGAAYDQQKDIKDAIAAYQKSLQMAPENLDVERALAGDLLADNQLGAAANAYEDIAAGDPTDARAYLSLSEIQRRQGNYEQALTSLQKAKKLVPNSLEVTFNEGLLDDALGRFSDSEAAFQSLVKGATHANGQYTDQEKDNLALFLNRLAIVDHEDNKTDEAIAAYQQMATLGGDYAEQAYESEVDDYRDVHNYAKATEVAHEAAQKNPKNQDLQLMYAQQLADSGHAAQGIALAKSQLTGKPSSDIYVYRALVTMYTRLGRWKDAWNALDQVQKLSKDKDDQLYAWFLKGALLDRQQKYPQAEAAFRSALAIDPNNSLTLNYLGYMMANQGVNLHEALGMIQKAVKLDPQNYAYRDSLAWAYYKLGNYALAETNEREAVKRDSLDPTVHFHLGQIYEKNGQLKQAAEQWEAALKEFAVTSPSDTEPGDRALAQKLLDRARVRLAKEAAENPAAQPGKP